MHLEVAALGFIKTIYNFVMGLIGLVFLAFLGYVFIVSEWQEHREQQQAKEREQIATSVAQASRERGLGDLNKLRQEYLSRCSIDELLALEGNPSEICEAMADALLDQSQKREMKLSDQAELGYQLCALEAEQEDADADEWCDRQEWIDYTLHDAVALGLCAFDRAWVFDPEYASHLSKRGTAVYLDQELRVDCGSRLFEEWDYDGFFDGAPEDEEWPLVIDQVYEALESENRGRVIALLDSHEFGKDEHFDLWLLSLFIDDRFTALLPAVLERNGGKVNFDTNYYNQPLSQAIEADSPKTALLLLDAGADPIRPHAYGRTPVVNAASHGMLDVVKELVSRGADVNGVVGSESLDFAAPLRWASWNGHGETARWLLENGATITPQDPSQFPMWESGQILDDAVVGGDLKVVETLIEMGAQSEEPLRLFEGAVAGSNPDVLLLLFDQGYELPEVKYHDRIYDAVVDVIKEEGRGRVENGVVIFELLLERGFDMSKTHESGWNYAHQAIIHYAPPTIQLDSDDERAPLVREQRVRFVKRVIDEVIAAGIDIDHRHESRTMLMEAADGGQPELVGYLLDLGADATLENDKGQSALDIAVREGRRLTAYWDDNEALKTRFAEVIEMLGGTRDMLRPPDKRTSSGGS